MTYQDKCKLRKGLLPLSKIREEIYFPPPLSLCTLTLEHLLLLMPSPLFEGHTGSGTNNNPVSKKTDFVERISGLGEDFGFSYISPQYPPPGCSVPGLPHSVCICKYSVCHLASHSSSSLKGSKVF